MREKDCDVWWMGQIENGCRSFSFCEAHQKVESHPEASQTKRKTVREYMIVEGELGLSWHVAQWPQFGSGWSSGPF